MSILRSKRKQESGSVLLVVLCIAIVLGIVAMGYMYLVSTQHRLVARSQSWNTALNVAEAGIEDGMAQLNVSFGTNYSPSALTNWTLSGGIYGPRSNTIPMGSYSAIIITTNPFPTIIATGYTAVPFTDRAVKRVI